MAIKNVALSAETQDATIYLRFPYAIYLLYLDGSAGWLPGLLGWIFLPFN